MEENFLFLGTVTQSWKILQILVNLQTLKLKSFRNIITLALKKQTGQFIFLYPAL